MSGFSVIKVKCPRCSGTGKIYRFNGKRLRADRKHMGLSLREVARRAKISAPYLSDIELDRRTPSMPTRHAILAAMRYR